MVRQWEDRPDRRRRPCCSQPTLSSCPKSCLSPTLKEEYPALVITQNISKYKDVVILSEMIFPFQTNQKKFLIGLDSCFRPSFFDPLGHF